jgi:hypothetical protein
MSNQNVADISTFESLQANQHEKAGMSQMAVFNKVADVEPTVKKLQDAFQKIKDVGVKLNQYNKQWNALDRDIDSLAANARGQLAKELYKVQEVLKTNPKDAEALKEMEAYKKLYGIVDKIQGDVGSTALTNF